MEKEILFFVRAGIDILGISPEFIKKNFGYNIIKNPEKKNKITKNKITKNKIKKSNCRTVNLLDIPPKLVKEKFGYNIIHQTWKDKNIPINRQYDVKSVINNHNSKCCYFLWSDEDNYKLINRYYPEFKETYNNLLLPVQKVDLCRLLYLHRYGGLYVDLDYTLRSNFFEYCNKNLPEWKLKDIFIVKSGVILNEIMQNSLMMSKTQNENFWYKCAINIKLITEFINKKGAAYNDNKHLQGMEMLNFFHTPVIKNYANQIFTLYISGPAVLDKTYCEMCLDDYSKICNIGYLSTEKFYSKKIKSIATHNQGNSWVQTPF